MLTAIATLFAIFVFLFGLIGLGAAGIAVQMFYFIAVLLIIPLSLILWYHIFRVLFALMYGVMARLKK